MPVTGKTICRRKGVVQQEYSCKKFDFDPFRMCVNRIHNVDFTRFEKEDYSIE